MVKSKDPKIPPRLRVSPEWTMARDADGHLIPEGRLWEFIDRISVSRREGKNRRDGATVRTRVVNLADEVGRMLFAEILEAETKGGVPVQLTAEERATLDTGKEERRQRTARL